MPTVAFTTVVVVPTPPTCPVARAAVGDRALVGERVGPGAVDLGAGPFQQEQAAHVIEEGDAQGPDCQWMVPRLMNVFAELPELPRPLPVASFQVMVPVFMTVPLLLTPVCCR